MRLCFTVLLLQLTLLPSAQRSEIDSLRQTLSTSISDSTKISNQIKIANAFKSVSIDSALSYISNLREVIDTTRLNRHWIDYTVALSNIKYTNGDVEESIIHVNKILDNKWNRRLNYSDYADLTHRKALCLYQLAKYDEASTLLIEVLDTLSNHDDFERMGGCYNTLGNIMRYNQRLDQALKYYQMAYEYNTKAENHSAALRNIASLATGYSMMDSFTQSIQLFKQAISGSIKYDDPFLEAFAYGNLGLNYVDIERPDSAQVYLQKALEMYTSMNNKVRIARTSSQLSRLYLLENKYDDAIKILKPSLEIARELRNAELENAILVNLSKAYAGTGNYKDAYQLSKAHGELTDSILTEQIQQEVSEAQTKFETEKKEAEIQKLSLEDELKQNKLNQQRYGLIGLAVMLALLTGLLYRIWQQKKSIDQKNQENESLLKEIHHRVKNNLQVISSLLKLQSRSINDEITQKVLLEGQDRVRSMALIHQNLYQDGNLRGIDMEVYLTQLTRELTDNYQVSDKSVDLKLDVNKIQLDVDTVVPIGLIINELITNSLKYAFTNTSNPTISVSLYHAKNSLLLTYEDNGSGFDIHSVPRASLGMRLIRSFSNRLQAETTWDTDGKTSLQMTIKDFELAE